VGIVLLGGVHDRQLEVGEEIIVIGEQSQVDFDGLVHGGIVKALGHAVTIGFVGALCANCGQIVLAVGMLDMG
jgi:S1-C subfamily serine protease